jgi:hypothetical protein
MRQLAKPTRTPGPAKQATSTRMPTQQDFAEFQQPYLRLSPHPRTDELWDR